MIEQYGWHNGACLADFTVCKVQDEARMALSPSKAGEGTRGDNSGVSIPPLPDIARSRLRSQATNQQEATNSLLSGRGI
jgi:hypothetical protein